MKTNSAFTLLEIIIAIVFLSIMTLGITSTMRQNTRISQRVLSRTSTTISGQIAMDRLQRELELAFDEHLQGSKTFFKADETGAGTHLNFTFLDSETRTLYERRGGGIVIADYRLEKEDGKSTFQLIRKQTPLALPDKLNEAEDQILAEGVVLFRAEFYDLKNDKWLKSWDTDRKDTTPNFPKAVKIEIQTVDTSIPEKDWKDKSLSLMTSFPILNEWEAKQ